MNTTFYQARMRKIRARNEVSLVIRRAEASLSTQPMRIEYTGARGFFMQSDAARAAKQACFILGEPNMDIAVDDRLTYDGKLIRVVFVQLNRLAATIAEGIVEE